MFKIIKIFSVIAINISFFIGCSGGATASDSKAPIITLNGSDTIIITYGTKYTDAGATASDNIDRNVKVIKSGSVNSSQLGTYTIFYTATDKAGNKTVIKRIVNVVDKTAPKITLNGNSQETLSYGTKYNDAGAIALDNVDGKIKVTRSGSVDSSKIGVYTLLYTAIDKAGNKTVVKRIVNVVDKIAPKITLNGKMVETVIHGTKYKESGVIAIDNVDGKVKVIIQGNINSFKVGVYTLTYIATDKSGNQTTVKRTIHVIDKTAPKIIFNGSNRETIVQYSKYNDFGVSVTDNVDKNIKVIVRGDVNSSRIGTYILTYNATDNAGNTAMIKKTVIVIPINRLINISNTSELRKALKESEVNSRNDILILEKGIYRITDDSLGTFKFKDRDEFNLSIIAKEGLTNEDVILTGSHKGQIFRFENTKKSTVVLKNLSIIDGNSTTDGGGIFSNQDLEIKNCKILNNTALNNSFLYGKGGGIYSTAGLLITKSTISGNKSYQIGGGFYSLDTNISDSIISNNTSLHSGGGFYTHKAIVVNSYIFNNIASYLSDFYSYGGGFYSDNVIVVNSIFTGNQASSGAIFYSYNFNTNKSSFISNNIFIKNKGGINAKGIFVNNIFSKNNKDISLRGTSKIYNNYIDYSKITNNTYNADKKQNLEPSIGEVYLDNNYKLQAESPVIDKGLNPDSTLYRELIADDVVYRQMVDLLKRDKIGNKRVHNNLIDMGAIEYGSTATVE